MERRLQNKLDMCNNALSLIEDIPDARIKFHLHRLCGSACRAQHLFRLVPPQISLPFAEKFDKDQLDAYSRFNNVKLTDTAITQLRLPFRKGGHGFTPLTPLLHGSYAASLIEAAPIRVPHPHSPSVARYIRMARPAMKIFVQNLPEYMQPEGFAMRQNLPNVLRQFEPQLLAERPERTHQLLFQAYSDGAANQFWHEARWKANPRPRDHNTDAVRRRIRFCSLVGTNAASFLTAHPSTSTIVHSTHLSVTIRRHLDLPVYEDTGNTLICPHCSKNMDQLGDHSSSCGHGFGFPHRHNTLRNALARAVLKPAGLSYNIEVPFLIPDCARRPADILVQPCPPLANGVLEKPIAYDVTVRSPYTSSARCTAATKRPGGAEIAERDKRNELKRHLRDAFRLTNDDPIPPLDWKFVPLAFDTYAAPSALATTFIEEHARKIAYRTSALYAHAKQNIEQCISYSIWSSIAEAILSRLPSGAAVRRNLQQV